jgi:anti-sigma regulatory factor (Ser/Thr protein kinase)
MPDSDGFVSSAAADVLPPELAQPRATATNPADAMTEARWELHSTLALGALPSAVPCARLHAKHVLWEWGLTDIAENVELVVSELVTNSIKATAALPGPMVPPIRLRLSSDRTTVVVEVWDGSTVPPVLSKVDATADGGRGLVLVDALSSRWGWSFPPEWGGKVTWAVVGGVS